MDKGSDVAADEAVKRMQEMHPEPHHPGNVDVQDYFDAKKGAWIPVPAPTPNIFQRINAVMLEVGGKIDKDGSVEIKGRTAYEYISHDAVTAHLRAAMSKHGIHPISSVAHSENNGNRVEMRVQTNFHNIDNPANDYIGIETIGYGADTQDKGPGKAFSYAIKSAYLKTFMLNSADDIEADQIDHETDSSKVKLADAQQKINQIDAVAVNNLNAALKGADSEEAVDELMKDNKSLLAGLPSLTKEHFKKLATEMKRKMVEE